MSESAADRGYTVDDALVEALRLRRKELGDDAPRIGLFLFDCDNADPLSETIARIPEAIRSWLSEVVVVQEPPTDGDWLDPKKLSLDPEQPVLVHRLLRASGFGGARKGAFEHAIHQDLSHVITMSGRGVHPPERLPELLDAIHSDPQQVVTASRFAAGSGSGLSGIKALRWAGHRLATGSLNRILGLRLHDYDTGYRIYTTQAIERIRYQLNSDGRLFDVQILIQLRALGYPLAEIAVAPAWREFETGGGAPHALSAGVTAVDYRLHQLHIRRVGRYFVDEDAYYTLKFSPSGSHMQIVDAIAEGSRVLDLGCSQGLLAKPLRQKNVRVTGVDENPPRHLADELEAYHQRDLDSPMELPVGREFDYVVISDVIEHLRNRRELLVSARRYLKEGGRLIVSTPNIALWFYRLSLAVGRFEYGARGVLDETHVHLFTRASFRREVERAGYRVVRERVTALPFEVVFRSTGRSRLVRSVSSFYHTLARMWPEMFAYQNILEAEITTLDRESIANPKASD